MMVEEDDVHPDEGTIHAWLDGALSPVQAARIETHAAACAACAERVAEARGLIAGASRVVHMLDETSTPLVQPVQDGSLWRMLRVTPARSAIAATLIVAIGITLTRQRTAVDTAPPAKETSALSAPAEQVAAAPMAPALPSPAPVRDTVLQSAIGRRLEADQPVRVMKRADGFAAPTVPPPAVGNIASIDTSARAKVAEGRDRRVVSEMAAGAAADRVAAAPSAVAAIAEPSCLQLARADGVSGAWEGVPLPVRIRLEPSSTITSADGTETMGSWGRGNGDTISIVLRGATTTTSGLLGGGTDAKTGALTAMRTQLADAVSARKAAPARVEQQRAAPTASVAVVARRINCSGR